MSEIKNGGPAFPGKASITRITGELQAHQLRERAMTQTQQVQPNYLAHRASLLNPNWKYIPAAQTDIMKRFRAMGWVPPSEKKDAAQTA